MTNRACSSRDQHAHRWVVLARNGAFHPRLQMRWVPSNVSKVWCPACGVAWRTSALYVRELPDADQSMRDLNPREERIAALVDEYPLLAELTYVGNGGTADQSPTFLADVGRRFLQYGTLTPRQIAASEGAVQRLQARRAQRDEFLAEQAALRASLGSAVAPSGRHTVVGLIEAAWREDPAEESTDLHPFGAQYARTRMRVRADEGFSVECTVPASLLREHGDQLNGRRIELPVDLSPKWDAPTEAWGSYPSQKSRLLPEED